jgi:hypothetical protein
MFFGGDPFDHFGHGGGRGGGRPSGQRAASAADTTKLYETLGVSPRLSVNVGQGNNH